MKIEKKEIIDSLNRSGYFLESRVLETLAKEEYKNFPNQTYPDPITEKSREIDILSIAPRITEHLELNQPLQFEYQYQLLIECINNDQPIAFFKRPDKEPYTIYGKFLYAKTERNFKPDYYNKINPPDIQFKDFTTFSKEFHYNQFCRNTQYCSFSKKRGKNEWMASHPDALHDTFNKLFDYAEHKLIGYEKWMKETSAWRNDVFTTLFFPVIIVQNELIEVSENNGEINIENKKHLVFDFNRFSDKREGFLIDIISEDYLPTFLEKIRKSVNGLKDSLIELYKDVEIIEIEYGKKN